MKFNIEMENDSDTRQAYRTRVPGLQVRVREMKQSFDVKDLSASGFAFSSTLGKFHEGDKYEVDLLLNKKAILVGIEVNVARVLKNGIVGCKFEELDRRNEARLDKLVLEVQKRQIAMRKASKPKEK
jgi:hypothetical protein